MNGKATVLWWRVVVAVVGVFVVTGVEGQVLEQRQGEGQGRFDRVAFVEDHCLDCHDAATDRGGLNLEAVVYEDAAENAATWEKVYRRVHARQMPPASRRSRPSDEAYAAATAGLAQELDAIAAEKPNAGRVASFRRLTRTEYANAVRDLLAIDIDADELLPGDESSHGFDNITVGELSPTLLDRYLSAAQRISRLAVGSAVSTPQMYVFRSQPDETQEWHVEGLPLGTRGGMLIEHTFARDGEYEVAVRLSRDRNEEVEGLNRPHDMDILLDRGLVERMGVEPPSGENGYIFDDDRLRTRFHATAGPHRLGVTFVDDSGSIEENKREPSISHFNYHRHPRLGPAVYQVTITGPYKSEGVSETPSRRRVFSVYPQSESEEEACAREIVGRLMRLAYRRPLDERDLEQPLAFYREAREAGGFEAGIEMALSAILVSPEFLFRIERDPEGVAAGEAYRVSDVELASRLSFFLWSSIPDDELLGLAERGELRDPVMLAGQVRRMLSDERSGTLATNFADQWLQLRNLESKTPDLREFPDFDNNLRRAFRTETLMLFEDVMRRDVSVLELIGADYTFLNERLAKHYGVPHVYGNRFRRVELPADSHRGGLLRQGSILTTTSYATRTSPVIRGHWLLANILGTPPPPPPANVPALEEKTISSTLSVRERLMKHREDAACATCHNLMDPAGFALENFDAVGRWRSTEFGEPVDVTGGLPDGREFSGVEGLEAAVLERPDMFVGTMSEKLLTYALGRGIETYDAAAVRRVVSAAEAEGYRFSSLIVAIAQSVPFQMRQSP